MKHVPRLPIPWDMVVFLTITTAGFGYSVQKLVSENSLGVSSTVSRETASAPLAGKSATADLGCVESSLPKRKMRSEMGSIRLRGKFCQLSSRTLKNFEGVLVRNRTNGFEGTVFFREQDASFVTDFMVLSHGTNEIEIEWRDPLVAEPRRIFAEVTER
jgi:hypothetical protein